MKGRTPAGAGFVAERKALTEALKELNENMTTMGNLAQIAIRKGMEALIRLDPDEAEAVIALDKEAEALQQVVEKQCVELIALHAPVARDLRTVTTSLKITTDLDRIIRYAADIAEVAMEIRERNGGHFKRLASLQEMADHTIAMVDKAIKAFVNRDAESVRNIVDEDDTVDSLHDTNFREMVTYMMDGTLRVEDGARYLLVNRYLERIADHAVNIGERVVYMVTGRQMEAA